MNATVNNTWTVCIEQADGSAKVIGTVWASSRTLAESAAFAKFGQIHSTRYMYID